MRYPGGKSVSGAWQRICAAMPPHEVYIEPFLGGGNVLERKIPARHSIASDVDAGLIGYHKLNPLPNVDYIVDDARSMLERMRETLDEKTLIYLDPPYMPETRSKKKIYNFELDDAGHLDLLSLAVTLRARVMISGYRCPLYDEMLIGWHRQDYRVGTRGGPRIESLWCNFEPGRELHDTRFVGDGYRERERIKRKKARWISRLKAMPAAEREVIRSALAAVTEHH